MASVTKVEDLKRVGDLADLIEFRLDYLSAALTDRPAIFTFRKFEQGGQKELPEEKRWKAIEKALSLEPAYLDLETDTDPQFIQKIAERYPKTKLIGSYHNFQETPDLEDLFKQMQNPNFAIYKIAVRANSTLDMLRLMIFLKKAKVPIAAMSLGPFGKPSRVIGKILGSSLTYAGVEEDDVLHRYSLQTLHERFQYRKIDANTRIYGLIGDPIEQSPGEIFHNPRLKNGVYLKFPLKAHELEEFFHLAKELPFGGLSVTMPLKEKVLDFLDENRAQEVGAVNTVVFAKGKTIGYNTDGLGALNAIEKHLDVKEKKIALLGAGGTAKAIAFEARKRGADVTIFNRTVEKAQSFGFQGCSLEELATFRSDLLINTIPVPSILDINLPEFVMDVVYHPKETPLLQRAKQNGSKCIYGDEMYVEQAILQLKLWN